MKLKDLKVNNYLFHAIDRTVLDTILKKDTAKEIWNAMKKRFEGNARVKRSHLQALHKEFETLKMRFGKGKFNYVVCSIEESKDIDALTVDEKRKRERSSSFNKATVECYRCHNLGHFLYECPSGNKEINYTEFDEEDEMSYMELYEARRENAWFFDLGCSNHMCDN
ncbi:hypothetical protein FEM48_Zijuj01G0142500 [Ziziphus jujuba var. spinosa]|uniref:CCHC-type domain-containing protein n=1 Tax=Ziziphus jujuba var. spinosa TaxID=714518 RepID=A0A978W1R4_ZIZJJ|nr:hypothetical protein FEM48_Zijuj01G0142500 [Ziziphus jujuba var. spinosa]